MQNMKILVTLKHSYNALHVVMVKVRVMVMVNPNLAYNYDYTAI